MGFCMKILAVLVVGVAASIGYWYSLPTVIPTFDPEEYWGPKEMMTKQDKTIRPFKVKFDEEMIADLRYRLINHRQPPAPLEGVGFEYGFNSDALNSWVKYWAEEYPFKKQEQFMNKYPQFKTNIQGLDIAFLWVKPKVPPNVQVLPLLLIHGWPGSIREFYETIPLLTRYDRKRNYALEVIAPHLPGFGFSNAAVRPGLGATEVGVVLRNLMQRIGFQQFYVQGGDWGAWVASSICTLYPEEVLGHHSNLAVSFSPKSWSLYILGSIFPSWVADENLENRLYPLLGHLYWVVRESGYFHIQATKPDTIGVALSDSPAGQLAYIFQLVAAGTRRDTYSSKDGRLDEFYTRSSLIDNLMMYWAGDAFTTAARLYADTANMRTVKEGIFLIPTPVPTCSIHAKDEIIYQTPAQLQYKFPALLRSTVLDDYGHFLALEAPKVFADDVLSCVDTIRDWRRKNKRDL